MNFTGCQWFWWKRQTVGVDVHRSQFDPQVVDQGPRPRVGRDGADPSLDHFGRKVPTHPSLLYGDLRRDTDPVSRLWDRYQCPVGDAVQRGRQQCRTRNRQPVKQIPGGVDRPDRLGDHSVDRSGVQTGLDLERRGPGDGVPRRDRGLHRCRAAPGGQQREVQVDPAARRHRQQLVTQQRAVGHHRAAVGRQLRQLGDELGGVRSRRAQHRDALLECQAGHRRGLRPAVTPRRGVRPGEHRDHVVPRRVDETAQRGQRGFGGAGKDEAHRTSVGSSRGN